MSKRTSLANLVLLIALWLTIRVFGESRSERYRQELAAAEREKAEGNFAAMETSLVAALEEAGPDDGYVWGSLAGAQAREGKWKESIASAQVNLSRLGYAVRSYRQLFDSHIIAGNVALARQAMADADRLPPRFKDEDVQADLDTLGEVAGPQGKCRHRNRVSPVGFQGPHFPDEVASVLLGHPDVADQ